MKAANGQFRCWILSGLQLAGLAIGIAMVLTSATDVLDAAGLKEPQVGFDAGRRTMKRIGIATRSGDGGVGKIVLLGDSTLIDYKSDRTVPYRLQRIIDQKWPGRYQVTNLAGFGFSAFDYYPFADRIAEIRPAAIIFSFHLASLSSAWSAFWSREEALGWLRRRRLVEALNLPLYWWGVTFDRLLLYTGLVRLGQVDRWREYRRDQIRAGHWVDRWRSQVQRYVYRDSPFAKHGGMPPRPVPLAGLSPERFTPPELRAMYGTALDGCDDACPVLQIFDADLSQFHIRGVPILVYVVPINIEYLRSAGVYDAVGLAKTMRAVEQITNKNGGVLLDLHDLLPDRAFRDPGGHFTVDGEFDGPLLVSNRIATALSAMISNNESSPDR